MADDTTTKREREHTALALAPPRMTVLSDRPLHADDAHLDHLNLPVKLGPIYDIIRHPDTQTPLAVAIYGDWGTGKTSAMKWLEGLLYTWNRDGAHEDDDGAVVGKVIRPVWFCPWKYHDQEDVWRGLIAEVILASIEVRGATMGRVKKALKEFGLFLGRSFLHVLANVRLSSRDASVSLQSLYEIYDDYRATSHPEAGYLNEFENTLRKWVRETISNQDERLVVFIDDLDRCMPEVALKVLEALKLYLDIPDLIFVVGVDRGVIDQLVREHYDRLGLEPEKSKHYLAKMFQVEVVMAPTEAQAEGFFDHQLTAISEHTNQYWREKLSDAERAMFRRVVLRLAERNPRELKRLLNSALIHGAGVLHVAGQPFHFAQGMQVYLVRKILEERYTMGLHVDTTAGMRFFHEWSALVRAGAPPTVANPEELAARLAGSDERLGVGIAEDDPEWHADPSWRAPADEPAPAITHPYQALLRKQRYAPLRRLLADAELGELMWVAYPADTRALAESSTAALPQGLVRETIARILNKSPNVLGPRDFQQIRHLTLEGLEITDLAPLAVLTELEELVLSLNPVADLTPIEHLRNLTSLNLADTQVTDLSPLRHLTGLRSLNLRGVQAHSLSPLAHLTALTSLSLANTHVTDLALLARLTQLTTLSLVNTQVSDLAPLAGLSALTVLHISLTQVSDLSPLSGLGQLETLSLRSTPVTRLEPLYRTGCLPRLRLVHLQGAAASDGEVASLKAARPELRVLR